MHLFSIFQLDHVLPTKFSTCKQRIKLVLLFVLSVALSNVNNNLDYSIVFYFKSNQPFD